MQNSNDENKLTVMENMTSNLKYDEFRWILKELRVPVSVFTKKIKMSPSTLQSFGDEDILIPLFVIDELLEVSETSIRLLHLRRKYAQIHGLKTD